MKIEQGTCAGRRIIKRIHQGQMLPPFYGVAWRDWYSDSATCLPVPFNLVAGALRAVWVFVKHGGRPVPISPREAYEQGRRDALKEGA